MRGLKKLLTGIIAGAMALSITFAAGSAMTANAATITIKRDQSYNQSGVDKEAVKAQKYTVYKIFSAEKAANGNYSYYVTDTTQKSELEKIGFSFNQITVAGETRYLANYTAENGDALAKAIQDDVDLTKFTNVTEVAAGENGKTEIPNVDDGYYLIVSSVGNKLIANTFVDGGTVTEKNVYPTLDKKQKKENSTGDYSDDNVAVKVGDIIDYSIDVTIPYNTSADIYVYDKMSKGLELDSDSLVVTGITTDDYEQLSAEQVSAEGYTFGFKFKNTVSTTTDASGRIAPKVGQITFKARVTADALVDTGRKNEAELKYGNYSVQDNVPYSLVKTGAHKYDGVSNANLAGAEFTLKVVDGENLTDVKVKLYENGVYYPSDDENATATVVSNADGLIIIRGLEPEKNYKLVETKAPNGYNLPAAGDNVFDLTLEEDTLGTDGSITNPANLTQIANYSGVTLPSTGGIGTTIFYIIGGLLIVAAVVFFVVRRRADAE